MKTEFVHECPACNFYAAIELDHLIEGKFFSAPFKCDCGEIFLLLLEVLNPEHSVSMKLNYSLMEDEGFSGERRELYCHEKLDELITKASFRIDVDRDFIVTYCFDGFLQTDFPEAEITDKEHKSPITTPILADAAKEFVEKDLRKLDFCKHWPPWEK